MAHPLPTAFYFHRHFLDHVPGEGHPERPERLEAIKDRLEHAGLWERLRHPEFQPAPASDGPIERLHTAEYIARLRQACQAGRGHIDTPDSGIVPDSEGIARLAVGAVLGAVDDVMAGRFRNAFCAVRPPGHHAEAGFSMGFCLYGNVAIAADHLIHRHGLSRVATVDFDVHHGNGTQHLLERRADILKIDLHEDPLTQYPGTGFEHETGLGPGEGFMLNICLPAGCGDAEYAEAFEQRVVPRLEAFKPEFLLVSAGFDAAKADPLGHMAVSADGFEAMARSLKSVAERCCGGRLVATLEGGYDLQALSEGVERFVRVWLE